MQIGNMRIVVTSPSFSKHEYLSNRLLKLFPDAILNTDGIRFKKEELIKYLQDADGAIIGLETIDNDVLNECKNLKIIAKYGVGLDNINLEACKKRDIAIGWSGGVNRLSVAEMAIGFMLMLCRNLYITSNQLKNGTWNKNGGIQLSGKTIGIIGFGYIGQEVARLLSPFNCKILAVDIIDKTKEAKSLGVEFTNIEAIYRESDIITIHTPLTQDTKNLINSKTIDKLKNSAFVINTARGGIVNENDLKEALLNQKIAGAALDVYLDEPLQDASLYTIPNLICTPHIGGNSNEAIIAMGDSAISHLKKFFKL